MDYSRGKELALITAYILDTGYLMGSIFSTFDKAYSLAEKFLEKYPLNSVKWGVELEWDETVEKFVLKNI